MMRVPIIVTGNDFSTLYAPLLRDGRMDKFLWEPTAEDKAERAMPASPGVRGGRAWVPAACACHVPRGARQRAPLRGPRAVPSRPKSVHGHMRARSAFLHVCLRGRPLVRAHACLRLPLIDQCACLDGRFAVRAGGVVR